MMEMHGDKEGKGGIFQDWYYRIFSLDSDLRVESICVCVILKCSFVLVF